MPADAPVKPEQMITAPHHYLNTMVGYPACLVVGTSTRLNGNIVWGFNSGEPATSGSESPLIAHNPFRNPRQFIAMNKAFEEQLEKRSDIFEGQNLYGLREKMRLSADAIAQLSPDKVSLEVSHEGSLFYKAIKNGFNIYFEHFIIDEFDDSDEAIVTVYQGDQKVLNYGGSLCDAVAAVNNVFVNTTYAIHA